MRINNELIEYLEDLSFLCLTGDEKQRLAGDLGVVLDGMARLNELDTENIPERSHPFDDVNAFRGDEVSGSFDRELILKNAPHRNAQMIIAPKTVE